MGRAAADPASLGGILESVPPALSYGRDSFPDATGSRPFALPRSYAPCPAIPRIGHLADAPTPNAAYGGFRGRGRIAPSRDPRPASSPTAAPRLSQTHPRRGLRPAPPRCPKPSPARSVVRGLPGQTSRKPARPRPRRQWGRFFWGGTVAPWIPSLDDDRECKPSALLAPSGRLRAKFAFTEF